VVDFAELSDPGRDPAKQINEDACAYAETAHGHLAVVCDGMGGHAGGRQASETAIHTIFERFQAAPAGELGSRVLESAIAAAGRAVHAIGGTSPQELRPGSTCVAVLIHEAGADVAHVGDSRAYLVRTSAIQRLTRDHSMVQQMVDAGVIGADEAANHPEANKITRALGMSAEVEVELSREPVALASGDTLLLVTDGLTDLVSDAEILSIVHRRLSTGPAVVCQELISLANERGGHDNITVQVLHVVEAPPARLRAPDPTYVDVGGARPSGTEPGRTLLDDRPGPTLPGDARPPPAPTLLDEPNYGDRSTEPGQAPKPAPIFTPDLEHAPGQTRQARVLVAMAGAAAAVICIGVVGWWIVGAVRKPNNEEPPPAPTAAATIPVAPATSIEPEPEARPVDASAAHDAAARKDAGARDAAAARDAAPKPQ
jgi:protein phosphatase